MSVSIFGSTVYILCEIHGNFYTSVMESTLQITNFNHNC